MFLDQNGIDGEEEPVSSFSSVLQIVGLWAISTYSDSSYPEYLGLLFASGAILFLDRVSKIQQKGLGVDKQVEKDGVYLGIWKGVRGQVTLQTYKSCEFCCSAGNWTHVLMLAESLF